MVKVYIIYPDKKVWSFETSTSRVELQKNHNNYKEIKNVNHQGWLSNNAYNYNKQETEKGKQKP